MLVGGWRLGPGMFAAGWGHVTPMLLLLRALLNGDRHPYPGDCLLLMGVGAVKPTQRNTATAATAKPSRTGLVKHISHVTEVGYEGGGHFQCPWVMLTV